MYDDKMYEMMKAGSKAGGNNGCNGHNPTNACNALMAAMPVIPLSTEMAVSCG